MHKATITYTALAIRGQKCIRRIVSCNLRRSGHLAIDVVRQLQNTLSNNNSGTVSSVASSVIDFLIRIPRSSIQKF